MGELQIVGLWDKPSEESQGMLALILTNGETHYISGMSRYAGPHRLNAQDGTFEELIQNGSVLPVNPVPLPENTLNPAAHWLGNHFLEKTVSFGAPELPDVRNWQVHERGRFEIAEPPTVYGRLENWLKAAAKLALKKPEKGWALSGLMRWTDPNHLLTGAMLWHTAPDDKIKETELAWYGHVNGIDDEGCVMAFEKTINDLKVELGV